MSKFCPLSEKFTLEKKIVSLNAGAVSFLFQKGFGVRECKQEVTKIYQVYPVFLTSWAQLFKASLA